MHWIHFYWSVLLNVLCMLYVPGPRMFKKLNYILDKSFWFSTQIPRWIQNPTRDFEMDWYWLAFLLDSSPVVLHFCSLVPYTSHLLKPEDRASNSGNTHTHPPPLPEAPCMTISLVLARSQVSHTNLLFILAVNRTHVWILGSIVYKILLKSILNRSTSILL